MVSNWVNDNEIVEVAHEALILHWERAKRWVKKSQVFLIWRKGLEPFLATWTKQNRDISTLLRGGSLSEAQRWYTERKEDLDAREQEFIEESLQQREIEQQLEAEHKELHKRLAETARISERKAIRNLSASLAAQSELIRQEFPQRSVLLAAEAVRLYQRSEVCPRPCRRDKRS